MMIDKLPDVATLPGQNYAGPALSVSWIKPAGRSHAVAVLQRHVDAEAKTRGEPVARRELTTDNGCRMLIVYWAQGEIGT